MGLKILHSADWHLDSPFGGFTGDRRAYLKEEQQKLPGKIRQLCQAQGCDLLLLAGDIFDGAYTRRSARLLAAELEGCGVPVFLSPGNHDFCGPGSPWLEEKWPENVHIFTGPLTSVAIAELDCRIYGAGYQSMDCPALLEGFHAQGPERYQIAVLHGDPVQRQSPYNPISASQVRESGLSYLALGHIHKAGSFQAGATLCGWPGAPMGRGMDETGEKGVYLVELGEGAAITFLPLDTPRFYDLQAETGENAALALENLLPPEGNRNFYRIALVGSGEGEMADLQAEFARFPNLELLDRREERFDLWGSAGADTLEGVYFRMLREKMEQSGPEEGEIFRLAAEISQNLLHGREVSLE